MLTRRPTCCLATVTDAAFLPGTVVLLSSFLHHNPWFDGDLVVIHRDLPDDARRTLARFPNLRFHDVGAALLDRVAAVMVAHPALRHKAPIFYSLEAFNLPDYEHVLKFDSDILCRSSVAGLLDAQGALLGCPDQPHFRRLVRHPTTYVPHAPPEATDVDEPATFNAGMLVVRPPLLERGVYDRLLRGVSPETWQVAGTRHTDSIVLNRTFRREWVCMSERYNYFVSTETAKYTRPRVPLGDAVLLHFIGRQKPWQPRGPMAELSADHAVALRWWDQAWQRACNVTP
jgi:lipopolysaccharide biosynthesis glycosyltransferase